jgi:purine nucleosidase
VAEYNMWADPHAVEVVLAAGLPIEFVGWDISRHHAVVEPSLADELRGMSPLGEFCVAINAVVAEFCATDTKLAGFDLPDPIAMAYAIDPSSPPLPDGSTLPSRPPANSHAGWS